MSRTPTGAPAGAGAPIDSSFSARLGKRAAGGDQRAFEAIFKRYHQELYRYCLAIVRDREDAEDALQATMAAALHSLPGDQREIPLRPWLYRVAHNESISLLRARKATADAEDADPVEAMTGSVASEVEGRDRLRQLVADMQTLPERQRSALVMRELSGLSYAEIAEMLASSEGAARQTVYEARTALFAFEEGRSMECDPVREAISSRDGRRLRGRKVRAHLRVCEGCKDFEAVLAQRQTDLQALCPPLPALAASGMLAGLLGGSGGASVVGASAGATVAGAGSAGSGLLGSGIAGGLAVKGASLVAATALAAGAADLGGVIDLPNPFSGNDSAREGGAAGEKGSGGATSSGSGEAGSAANGDSDGAAARGAAGGGDAGAGPREGSAPNHSQAGGRGEPGTPESGGPGNSANAPGQTGNTGGGSSASNGSGNSGSAPGQTGATPGQSGSTPGQGGSAPGQSGGAGRAGTARPRGSPGPRPVSRSPPPGTPSPRRATRARRQGRAAAHRGIPARHPGTPSPRRATRAPRQGRAAARPATRVRRQGRAAARRATRARRPGRAAARRATRARRPDR